MHKIIIGSLIIRIIVFIAILAFVFGVVALTKNVNFLWLLLLELGLDFIAPAYKLVPVPAPPKQQPPIEPFDGFNK